MAVLERRLVMTTVELKVSLPDELAKEAREAGLLTPDAVESMLRERMRQRRANRLFKTIDKLSKITPPITKEEIASEIEAARTERRKLDAARP